jgi:putative transposase
MPWKETGVMEEGMKIIGRLLSGERMGPLCREFGISRVTGHKLCPE